MEPLSLLVLGGIGALASLASAISSLLLKRYRSSRRLSVKLEIGKQKVELSGASEAELKMARNKLEEVMRSRNVQG